MSTVNFTQIITEANNLILFNKNVIVVNRNIPALVLDTLTTVVNSIGSLAKLFNSLNLLNDQKLDIFYEELSYFCSLLFNY